MTQQMENYCRRTELLIRLMEGDLSPGVSEACKDEIRRCLKCDAAEVKPTAAGLAEADE